MVSEAGRPALGTVLAFDTSGPVGSVAVWEAERVVARAELTRQSEHAARLLPAIDEVLEAAHVSRSSLDGIVVGEGPGSFTGVRVAAATAKGLCRSLRVPLWAVSSLGAAAVAAEGAGAIRYALFDARAERVYAACYGVGSTLVQTLVAPHAGELRDVLDGDVPGGATFVGDGAEKHRALIEGAGFAVVAADREPPIADGLVGYLARDPAGAPVPDPGSWEPAYVRLAGAERLWSR